MTIVFTPPFRDNPHNLLSCQHVQNTFLTRSFFRHASMTASKYQTIGPAARMSVGHRTICMSNTNSDEHYAKDGPRNGPEQQARNEPASEGVRLPIYYTPRKKARE